MALGFEARLQKASRLTAGCFLVRLKGLEPTHISVREPKSRMSTNSITGARENPAAAAAGCGAGNEARTRYLHLGKVALYRMSYARVSVCYFTTKNGLVKSFPHAALQSGGRFRNFPRDTCEAGKNEVYSEHLTVRREKRNGTSRNTENL